VAILNHERVLPFLGIFEDEPASRMFLVAVHAERCSFSVEKGDRSLDIGDSLDCINSKLNLDSF
jgi:hypothetical protein